jgi:hypothetical protein
MKHHLLQALLCLLPVTTTWAQFEGAVSVANRLDQRRANAVSTISGGAVTGFTLTNRGSGYATAPSVTVEAPAAGTTATATAVLGGLTAASFTVTSGTRVYTTAPTLTINLPSGGTRATAVAILEGGVLKGIAITNPGAGYTAAPTVTLSGGTTIFAGTAPTFRGNATNFCITSINRTSGGSGYTSEPQVRISPPPALTVQQANGGLLTPTRGQAAGMGPLAGGAGPLRLVIIEQRPTAASTSSTTISVPTTGLVTGMTVTGTGIPAGARIAEILSSTQYRLSANATVTTSQLLTHTSAPQRPATLNRSITLRRARIGSPFASGVPRYFLGEHILPPMKQADGIADAGSDYWRAEPLRPGERLSAPLVVFPNGTTTPTTTAFIPTNTPEVYYWSKHAEKVFASQPGRVTITWVSRQTEGGQFRARQETFVVSATTTQPPRTIYWTERLFDGPRAVVRDNRITTISPVYYPAVPELVANEVVIPGQTPVLNTDPGVIRKTLWFERIGTEGSIRAYNVEGRIMIEYLGNVRAGNDVHHFLGMDVVNIVRVPEPHNVTVKLGSQLLPHDGDTGLTATPKTGTVSPPLYGTTTRPDGALVYHAERETGPPQVPENGLPTSDDAYSQSIIYWMEEAAFGIRWPKYQDRYWQRWSPNLADYAHNTVGTTGSTAATGLSFTGSSLPTIIYQDDPANTQAQIDVTTQRFFVNFSSGQTRNRSLLKFQGGGTVWYVPVYTQAEDRAVVLNATTNGNTLTLTGTGATTAGLEVGMVVTGPGITGSVATILSITGSGTLTLSRNVSSRTNQSFTFTVESDATSRIVEAPATVGTRLQPPAGHELAGHISGGTCYYPAGYLNPHSVGVAAANLGAIIPVNADPDDRTLTVRWYKKVSPPSAAFEAFYTPGKIGRYTVSYPANPTSKIVIAQGVGTDDLEAWEAAGSVYYQNNSALPGYNPNEEHAFMLGTRAYALRDDLAITSGSSYTSEPYLLLAYTDPNDQRPAMRTYKVERTDANYDFDYTATAGTLLVKPYPLPLMPLPIVEKIGANGNSSMVSKDIEILGTDDPPNTALSTEEAYKGFTFKDRKQFTWIHRGGHDGEPEEFTMKLYYLSREGFFLPGATTQPAVGTVMPFLRAAGRSGTTLNLTNIDDGENDQPLPIIYRPTWPENAPELRIGETLTLPKFGLPQVRGQVSAQVLYQQSLALATAKESVTLHDPTREKTFPLSGSMIAIPPSIRTTSYLGKSYFQNLPPHLQQRFYFDPLRGTKGTLVFKGEFHDEIAGEDYLDLNVLAEKELAVLKALIPENDTHEDAWHDAIDGLKTKVETFIPNEAQAGSFKVGPKEDVTATDLAAVTSPDTAVDSYALTATGAGAGWVTMVFGNGAAFTPEGDPVQVKVFKVAPQLYTGDLKVITSANPLDEQVTLRHSGDYAGKPEDYEFEWRWAPGGASAPPTYTRSWQRLNGGETNSWKRVRNPATALPTAIDYEAADEAARIALNNPGATANVPLPRTEVIRDAAYLPASGLPGIVLRFESDPLDFTSGLPGEFAFSADIGGLDGFVLYVNGTAALAHQAPAAFTSTDAQTEVVPGALPKQFRLSRDWFAKGPNRIEVAVFTQADAGVASPIDFRLDAAVEADVVSRYFQSVNDPNGLNSNTAIVGGQPTNPFGGPQFVINDRWFTMRYRPKAGVTNVAGSGYSRWLPPQFVEGWIKRVLRGINPFEQRVKDLFNNAVNTDTSVLTQAGTKWEGDVALTLGNVNDVGLIAIYETVLNRAKAMSIDANTNDPDTNNALMLAAGYLNDLYVLLGNEAFADAANPTISTEDAESATEINTSRYSFENQVASSLDEELTLLRGRDATSTAIGVAPVYNRLYWNYTGGINAGEVLYATNYNIKEKAGSSTADGIINAADAARMFPQGHGDAYGHYLTAVKGYYRLLANPNFNWQRRAEAVSVLGQPITVDFVDERKFAAAASLTARSAEQIATLTHRKQYKDNPATGWSHYRDTVSGRNWGLDHWNSRGTQGAYYHWVVANALLPDKDNFNTGVAKIDRTTVPELNELATAVTTLQSQADSASARLNPLGLAPGAIAFDLDPFFITSLGQELADPSTVGKSHFEQMYYRATRALVNASGSFNQAARMTRSLRSQENQLDDYNTAIVDQERAYRTELIELFGRPYSGQVGPGKTYAQDYYGPDLEQWYVVDRPNDLVNTTDPDSADLRVLMSDEREFNLSTTTQDIINEMHSTTRPVTVQVNPNQFIQYSDVFMSGMGNRPETGELQDALVESHRAFLDVKDALYNVTILRRRFQREAQLLLENIEVHKKHLDRQDVHLAASLATATVQKVLEGISSGFEWQAELADLYADTALKFVPNVVGLATDVNFGLRGSIALTGAGAAVLSKAQALFYGVSASALDVVQLGADLGLERNLTAIGFSLEEKQQAYEFEQLFRDYTSQEYALAQPLAALQQANERVRNVLARALRVLEERQTFRLRAAAVIQGYRTKDVTFRVFRNEALEQYRSLYDLASRYTYLAAKAYDYETGLLGSSQGQAVFDKIVASRSLGDLTDGEPQSTTSTLGDAGLAGVIAQISADFSVSEGRLGINNPDFYGTVFSIRGELFRILDDPNETSDDEAWQQTLEQHIVANVLADSDVVLHCRNISKPNGAPVPGVILPFSTTIQQGLNFFGLPLAAGDHTYSPTSFATKISNVGIVLTGYVGMDTFATGDPTGVPNTNDPNALSATPYVYFIPCGTDYMLAPPLGDSNTVRAWNIQDQALPLPYNLGANAFNSTQFFSADGTLSRQPWVIRKHQAFRAVADPSFFYGPPPLEFTNSRLIGRSVWNSRWKIVIPANTLLSNEQEGLNRFARTIKDIKLFLRTYSNSGN